MKIIKVLVVTIASVLVSSCYYPLLDKEDPDMISDYTYIIGPGDNVNIFVWGNPEVSTSIPVRPDGKITVPLVDDVMAMGKTPYELARTMEDEYRVYIRDPQVYIMVTGFQGVDQQQIRIIGQIGQGGGNAGNSRYRGLAIPYERDMTLLDVIIAIGSIGTFAAGNRASVIRMVDGELRQYGVRMDDLAEDGNMDYNVEMRPGDILIVPEAFF